jgi:serine/threonine protein kinase
MAPNPTNSIGDTITHKLAHKRSVVMKRALTWEQNWKRGANSSIGRGGQGHAFFVESLTEPIAPGVLKLLIDRKINDPKARRRMFLEVASLKTLASAGANVPRVLDDNTASFEGDIPLYFVMEYIRGKTLAQHILDHGCMSVRDAVSVGLALCDTVEMAVKEGIHHRDVKPENIIVKSLVPPDVVMVDYGLSFNESEPANITGVDETLDNYFLSLPERKGPYENRRDPRSDLTSICAIVLYCLTRCVPRQLRDSADRPPHRWDQFSLKTFVPDELQRSLLNALFDRGFANRIDRRFQTVGELRGRLLEVLGQLSSGPVEDIAAVAEREASSLLQRDEKTQLAALRHRAQRFYHAVQQQTSEISSTLATTRAFAVGIYNSLAETPPLPAGSGDTGLTATVFVKTSEHELAYLIVYRIGGNGLDGVLYRCTVRTVMPQGLFAQVTAKPTLVAPWTPVARFNSEIDLEPSVVAQDVYRTIAAVLPRLSGEVCPERGGRD